SLAASPAYVSGCRSVTAPRSGPTRRSSDLWIGLYAAGTGDGAYLAWLYVSCAQTPGAAQAAGSCPLQIPGSAPSGAYELRLFAANGFRPVEPRVGIRVTAAPSAAH